VGLVASSLLLLTNRGTGRAPDTLSLESVDIGQGDALLLRVPGGDATVIDTGPGPWSGRRLTRVLSRRGVREPVHLVLTHAHGDHAGGWATLSRLWPLATTAVPVTADAADPWEAYRPEAGPEAEGLLRGDTWSRGAAVFNVRWPPGALAMPDPNTVSVVLRVTWQDRELWLMGDALAVQERDLMSLGDPGVFSHRVLKAGHHGSRNASDPGWIAALNPEVAIVPAGFRNRFDHPHAETLETLRQLGLTPWVTGPSGGVRVSALRDGWHIETGEGTSSFTAPRRSRKP